MSKRYRIDIRLIEVERELSILGEHLELIEEQIKRSTDLAICEREARERELENDVEADESDWGELHNEYRNYIEVTLPRILRNPLLVTLFAVYESAVKDIARFMKKEDDPSLDDAKGDFLEHAKKYYKHVLHFELSGDNERWKRLKMLSTLRNAIAHTNGRWEAIDKKTRCKIMKYKVVNKDYGFILVSKPFLRYIVAVAKWELEDLLARYKKWETDKSPR